MERMTITSDIFNSKNMNTTRAFIKRCYKNKPKLLYYYLALSYCKEKNFDEAIVYFESALNEGLNNYLIYYNLGVLYLEKSDYYVSEMCFKKSLELNNSFEKSYINLAFIYCKTGDIKKAYRIIKEGTIYSTGSELANIEKKLFEVM